MNTQSLNILLVDDETNARLVLKSLLKKIKNIQITGEASNAKDALYSVFENRPDLILLDVNMPGISGIELTRLFQKNNIDIPIILISAYKNYAVLAIQSGIYDFLIKPVDFERLNTLINKHRRLKGKYLYYRVGQMLNSIQEELKIKINSNKNVILIKPSDIVYCSSDCGYSNIYLTNGKVEILNSSLKQIELELKQSNFFRLGRSKLLNIKYIKQINRIKKTCILEYGDKKWEIPASKKAITNFLSYNLNHA